MRVIIVTEDDVASLRGRLTREMFRAHLLGGGDAGCAEDGVVWARRVVESWLEGVGAGGPPSSPPGVESKGGGVMA